MQAPDPALSIPPSALPAVVGKPVRPRGRAAPAAAPGAAGAGLGTPTGIVSTPPDRAQQKAARARQRYDLQDCAKELLPQWRVASCLRAVIAPHVELRYHESGSASFGGLMACGSIWTCPVCAARIGARRAEEIGAGGDIWQRAGGSLFMLTLTMRHHKARRLKQLLDRLKRAYRAMVQGGVWDRFKTRYGIVGQISAREITWGLNGWHPHLHVLFFAERQLTMLQREAMADFFSRRWLAALTAQGEDATQEHGANFVEANIKATDYVTKMTAHWGAENEIAGVNHKGGKQGGATPQQLLLKYKNGDAYAGKRYIEYAEATKRSNWVSWSPGLRARIFGTEEEESNEQIANASEPTTAILATLTRGQWRFLLAKRLRGALIEQGAGGDRGAVTIWLVEQGIWLEPWQLDQAAGPGYDSG